jgi:hypothetical protein
MRATRKLNRRSFMTLVGGSVVGPGTLVVLSRHAAAMQTTDNDTGPNADTTGRGRTGLTDHDAGPNADRAGHGRGRLGGSGVTDQDTGSHADPAGRGRGGARSARVRPCTDSDSGSRSDSVGRGRHC